MSPERTRIPMSSVACQDIASIGTWSPEAPGEWESRDFALDLEAVDFLIQAMSRVLQISRGNVGNNMAACWNQSALPVEKWTRKGKLRATTASLFEVANGLTQQGSGIKGNSLSISFTLWFGLWAWNIQLYLS